MGIPNDLQPGLLPALPDLLQALRFAIVVVFTCGLGFLTGARRMETALFTGWGLACLVLVAAGCLAQAGLTPVSAALAAFGVAGLGVGIRYRQEGSFAPLVLLLSIPLWLILLSLRTTAFDDFSFWGPNLVAMCRTGHFPDRAHPLIASLMPAYPRAVALSGYATWLLGPDPSPAGIVRLLATGAWWNILVMLASAAALGRSLSLRFTAAGQTADRCLQWALAALAILLQGFLNPGFISKMSLSNMGDGATGSGFAMLTVLLFELPAARRGSWRILVEMAFAAAAIVFIRQDNLALLILWGFGVALGLLLLPGGHRQARIGWLALAAIPALAVWLVWTGYTMLEIPGGGHNLLPPARWHWAEYPQTLHNAGRVLLEKSTYTLLGLGFLAGFLRMLIRRKPVTAQTTLLLTATTLFVFGNAAFILFTYLATSFTLQETRTAVTFWRFLAQTGAAEMAALACLVPPRYLFWLRHRAVAIALCLVTALLPAALVNTRYGFRTDLFYPTSDLLEIGRSLAAVLPPNSPLLLLDNSDGSGYAGWIVKFGLQELGGAKMPVALSLAPQFGTNSQNPAKPAAGYVFVTQGPWRPAWFQGMGMQPWRAYLFRRQDSRLVLVQSWPVPHYGRPY